MTATYYRDLYKSIIERPSSDVEFNKFIEEAAKAEAAVFAGDFSEVIRIEWGSAWWNHPSGVGSYSHPNYSKLNLIFSNKHIHIEIDAPGAHSLYECAKALGINSRL